MLVSSDDPAGLLLVSQKDRLYAFEGAGLQVKWSFPTGEEDPKIDVEALYGEPAVEGNTIYVPGYDDSLYAIDLEDGTLREGWPFETGGVLVGGVAVGDDAVYLGSSDSRVYAVDFSGAEIWSFKAGDSIWSTPTLREGVLYVTSLDSKLYALNAETGVVEWEYKTAAGVASPPVIDDQLGLVYLGGYDNELRAIDLETHDEVWEVKADNWFWTRPLVANGVVYAGSLDGRVYALDAETGESVWPKPFDAKKEIRSAPVIVDDVLYIVERDGNVYGISVDDGTAAFPEPLALDEEVLSDPLVRAGSGEGGDPQTELIIVSKKNGMFIIDAQELQIESEKKLGG